MIYFLKLYKWRTNLLFNSVFSILGFIRPFNFWSLDFSSSLSLCYKYYLQLNHSVMLSSRKHASSGITPVPMTSPESQPLLFLITAILAPVNCYLISVSISYTRLCYRDPMLSLSLSSTCDKSEENPTAGPEIPHPYILSTPPNAPHLWTALLLGNFIYV